MSVHSSITLATLGPSGSDSEAAAKSYAAKLVPHTIPYRLEDGVARVGVSIGGIRTAKVELHPTYKDAIDSLVAGGSDLAVVASAAHDLSDYIFGKPYRAIKINGFFMHPTDEILFVRRKGIVKVRSVALYPATRPLVKGEYKIVASVSKSQAAEDCLECRADAAVITTRSYDPNKFDVVERYGAFMMSWNVFIRKDNPRAHILSGIR